MRQSIHDFDIIIKEFENDICFVCGKPFKLHKPIELTHCLRRSKTRMEHPYDSRKDDKENNPSDYDKLIDKLRIELAKFGLSANQSKLYLFLERHGAVTSAQIIKALRLPRTEIYYLLTILQNKGIVTATVEHPIKFSALSLEKTVFVLINAEKQRVSALEKQEKDIMQLSKNMPDLDGGNAKRKKGRKKTGSTKKKQRKHKTS